MLFLLLAGCSQDKGDTVYNSPPQVHIASPLDGEIFELGALVAFAGTVNDAEQPANELEVQWTSDMDGLLSEEAPSASGDVEYSTRWCASWKI